MFGNSYGPVYEQVFARCPPLAPPPAWDFLPADEGCRGTIPDPPQTLAALTKEFPFKRLVRAGVAELDPHGDPRLTPALTNPVGAVIACRSSLQNGPFDLLTARGYVGQEAAPVLGALRDSWTVERVLQTRVLIGTFDVREAVLLRQLDLPATLCLGFTQLSPKELRTLNASFENWEFIPAAGPSSGPFPSDQWISDDESAPASYHPVRAIKPTLVLLGWSVRSLTAFGSPLLYRAAAHLSAARRYLGHRFAGVSVWLPSRRELENLRFRLTLPRIDTELIREFLLESLDGLHDIEQFTAPGSWPLPEEPPATLADARADLLAKLAEGRGQQHLSARVRTAKEIYEAFVERDLIKPLESWALDSDDLVTRSAGVELATISGLLHRMGPLVVELQSRRFERVITEDGEPGPPREFAEYLQLVNRLGALMKDLRAWSDRRF